jgi:hypothetical protein
MTVRLVDNTIYLEGSCRVEDAEPLLQFLHQDEGRIVDLTAADHLHAAVVQILIALQPIVRTGSSDPFVAQWIEPLLMSVQDRDALTDLSK